MSRGDRVSGHHDVDDAGISYAYALNLATGLGLRPFALAPAVDAPGVDSVV